MESYIVHIYRRDARNPEKILGTIEEVGGKGRRVFKNFEDLWLTLIFRGREQIRVNFKTPDKSPVHSAQAAL